jgi:DNA-binding transcriptional MerR regulator
VANKFLSIGELSRQSGLSAYTLRYYESAGILKPVGRTPSGHRRYHREDVIWLDFVLRLKRTGMPLAEIKRYARLRAQGEETTRERFALLELHRERLAAQIAELQESADALDEKLQTYRDMLASATVPEDR